MAEKKGPRKGVMYTTEHQLAFGRALAQQRRTRGYTQQEIMTLIGTSKRVVSHLEREVRNPPAETLKKLSAALRIPMERLLEETPQAEQPLDRALSKRFELAQQLPQQARTELKRIIDLMVRSHDIEEGVSAANG